MRCCLVFELAGPRTHSERKGEGEEAAKDRAGGWGVGVGVEAQGIGG